MSAGPLTEPEVDARLAPLSSLAAIGLAVSGGPDSTALLLLADRWSRAAAGRPRLHVLTIDHGLRAAARAEAESVVALARDLGWPADLLVWQHADEPPSSDLQSAARDARYGLLAAAANRHGLGAVLLAHTLDDQAETLLIRLARGSGTRGLSGMPTERTVHGIRFLRPLLDIPKARLAATVAAGGRQAIEDPSNVDDRFLRSRIRRLMPALAEVGLDADRLAGTAARMARAEAALESATAELAARALVDHGGVAALDLPAMLAAPDEIVLRTLRRAVAGARPGRYAPRAAALETWLAEVRAGATPGRRSLAGVLLERRGDRLWVYAEAGRRGFPRLVMDRPGVADWDDRFRLTVRGSPPVPVEVLAAGPDDRRPDLPATAARSLPVARIGDLVVPPGGHRDLSPSLSVGLERL